MGRKHLGKRQCFHIFIACLIITIFSGCASLSGIRNSLAANDHLKRGQRLFEQGDFKEAAQENQQVLSLIDTKGRADRALFNLGTIYSHPDNAERDYSKAVEFFKRVLRDYPDSPLYNHAKAWLFLLNDIMQSKVQITNLSNINGYLLQTDDLIETNNFKKALDVNQKALSISGNGHRMDEILFNIGLIYAHYDNPDKNYVKSIEYFERLITEYPESPLVNQAKVWQDLLNVIEKSKQVDIEIDQKKKELAR